MTKITSSIATYFSLYYSHRVVHAMRMAKITKNVTGFVKTRHNVAKTEIHVKPGVRRQTAGTHLVS